MSASLQVAAFVAGSNARACAAASPGLSARPTCLIRGGAGLETCVDELAVIFDCDGVLADTETVAEHAAMLALEPFGLTYTAEAFRAKYLGLGGALWEAALDADHRERFGTPLPSHAFAQVRAATTEAVLADVIPVPGAVELALAVTSRKAVASSSPKDELAGKLARLGLAEAFGPSVVSGDEVRLTKPDPEIFLLAAERLGSPPHLCRVVEDSPNGVRAAVAAGMPVIGFSGTAPDREMHARLLRDSGAPEVAESMSDVRAWFDAQGVRFRAE